MAETTLGTYLNGFSEGGESAEDAIVKMQKNLSWLLTHLDSRNVQALNTSLTQIQSGDGATTLDGAQIIMRDAAGSVRAVLGKTAGGDFVFTIYSEDGKPSISMDDNGDAVFSGNVAGANITGSDITGSNIRIAPNTFNDYIALENNGTEDTIGLYYGGTRIGGIRMLDAGGMEIFGSKISIGSSSGTVSIAPGASGTFTADGKTVTVKKGVITSIA